MKPRSTPQPRPRQSAGFSLIELMVGLVIGLIGVFVMMQVLRAAEGQKRSITGSGDIQTNGTIALDNLQRELQYSGYGFTNGLLLGCSVKLPAPSAAALGNLAPVTINHPSVPGGDAHTDTLLIVAGSSGTLADGDWVNGYTGSSASVATAGAFSAGDAVIYVPSPVGADLRPSQACNVGPLAVQAVTAVAGSAVSVGQAFSGGPAGVMFNLGPLVNLRVKAYAVRNQGLTACDYRLHDCGDASLVGRNDVWVPVESNVVSLRAQYGHDRSLVMDAQIDEPYDQNSPSTGCGWLRTSAIELALVMRNPQFEGGAVGFQAVTPMAPLWRESASLPIDLSSNADWQRYRYRVFQTVVPLRNLAWVGANTANQNAVCP